MGRRELQEINAGSMADIAFLLLIFFLVTTTMDTDEGINATLPQKTPPDMPQNIVKERNVFKVIANKNDELLVEDDLLGVDELKDKTIEFLRNPSNDENLPEMQLMTLAKCEESITTLKRLLGNSNAENSKTWEKELSKWEDRKRACEWFGNYRMLPDVALISLQNDNGTSYELYITVQNELNAAVNELRNDLVFKKFGRSFKELDSKNPDDKLIIKAVRQVIPKRISEARTS